MNRPDLSTSAPPAFNDIRYPLSSLRHWFAGHGLRQQPSANQFRDDHRRVFGHAVIDVLGNPNANDYCRDRVAVTPFVTRAGELIADAVTRGQYVLFDEYAVGETTDTFLHPGAEVLTRPAWAVALRELECGWHFWTAYFKHKSDWHPKTHRAAVRRLLDFYTDGTWRVPTPDFRVWLKNRTRYRTNIRFGDLRMWGGDGDGGFDLGLLPTW